MLETLLWYYKLVLSTTGYKYEFPMKTGKFVLISERLIIILLWNKVLKQVSITF